MGKSDGINLGLIKRQLTTEITAYSALLFLLYLSKKLL
jgi:hypothetical protein